MPKAAGESTWFSHDPVDRFKVLSQQAAREIVADPERLGVLKRFGTNPMEDTRGESVYLHENGDHYIAHLIEGLGTKSLVADKMDEAVPDVQHCGSLGQDTIAMKVNDMVTLGAFPVGISMYVAVGDGKWMQNEPRLKALIEGWKQACIKAMCVWEGGETPILKDIVAPDCAELLGSAWGKTIGRTRFYAKDVQSGDRIVFFESSGIHANGLTDARTVASKLKNSYLTEVPGTGKSYGELLLRPTHLYNGAIETMVRAGIRIRYGINITGHGWSKLMRAPQPLTYVIERVPRPDPVFGVIQEHTGFTDKQMFSKYNMSAGFAIIVPPSEILPIEGLARKYSWPFRIFTDSGHVAEGPKQVIIEPKNLTLEGSTLAIR
jgi:phosphoribosylformylglycinamidine cyclo-ligase